MKKWTKGEEGFVSYIKEVSQTILYSKDDNTNFVDSIGAGDTFLSALVVEYIKSQDIIKSIRFAQKCTTMVVQKQGVTTV